jgi:glycosyltransferase involved in cell wall biosynthesis
VPRESSGLETYARELLHALLRQRPRLRVTAFVNSETSEAAEAFWREIVPTITVPIHARRRWDWVRGEQQLLPVYAQRTGVDLVHSLASTAPGWGNFARVVTIHDVIYRIYPEAHAKWRSLALRALVPMAAHRSHRIIVPSEATCHDLANLLGIQRRKMSVVPNGVGTPPATRWEPEEDVRRRFGLGTRPLLLTLSLKRPHKNLARLLEALAVIPSERRPLLVLAGHRTAYEGELRAHAGALGVGRDTRFLGWLPEPELEGLYRASSGFVFPSLYEGFGLPVLEAMTRGVPVACSDRGALSEVANGAALKFDPEDTRSIAAAIERLLGDPAERQRLSEAGRKNATRFSWEESALKTLEAYESALAYSATTTSSER